MEEFKEFEQIEQEETVNEKKRPTFLTVLVVLTWISVAMMILTNLTGLVSGPLTEDALVEQELKAAEQIAEMKSNGQGEFLHFIEIGVERSRYLHEQKFYFSTILSLLISLLGAYAGWLLWSLKKFGFHLYIVYSLIGILQSYMVYPIDMVLNAEVYFNLAVSGLFVLMYSRNLHILK
jgi:hypothetical protein